jgi:hypothetical protein
VSEGTQYFGPSIFSQAVDEAKTKRTGWHWQQNVTLFLAAFVGFCA